jgi:hypothetical protein
VGVEFEKTRNLNPVPQNFFVPLHPEIGLRAFNAYGCSSGLRPFKKFNAAAQRFKALRAFNAAEPSAKLLRSGKIEIS